MTWDIPIPLSHGGGAHDSPPTIFVRPLPVAVPPLAAVCGGGVLGYATTMDISCCHSPPAVIIHRTVLTTTDVVAAP